ncbi:MAG: cytochrome c oxidase accessory protein CcoG [Pseudomonadota bacterium]
MESSNPNPAQADNELEESLYAVRQKIQPRAVHGWFANWRVALVLLTQLVYYGLPWLKWDGHQAVLFDLAARKFYIFGLTLWPQDFIWLTGLLVISALSLFLFTAVAGRLWCGFACPQTVYTEIFMWIEEWAEGNHLARKKLDTLPWNTEKLRKRGLKHVLWFLLAFWTGFTFVGYFTPITTLWNELISFDTGPWETFWIVFYAFATWGFAGFMREQVCKYMCPYARFQSVMFDPDTLIISYDPSRGEPRGPRSKKADYKAMGLGDCVDCGICVQVCPTGIDIRNGLQYECIGCAACIDGCDQVMEKMGYPKGLIRYTTENALKGKYDDSNILSHVLRPRVLVYSAILLAIISAFLITLANRVPLRVEVIRDRATLSRTTEDGRLENIYTVQILNMENRSQRYKITASGADDITVVADPARLRADAQQAVEVPIRLRIDPVNLKSPSTPIMIRVQSEENPELVREAKTSFLRR